MARLILIDPVQLFKLLDLFLSSHNIGVHNEAPKPFVWTRTADQILDSIARYARRTAAVQPS
jgi:hypothetical protein